ncbi:hypothetical protein Tco_0753081 [Tanacetum coccineum]
MHNRMFVHTAQDDCVLNTLRFVSKTEDSQVYGARLPEKTPTSVEKNKGIDLLSDVDALKATQLKKALKRSKRDTSIHQAEGSGEGTGAIPDVPDASQIVHTDSENESWGDSGDKDKGDDEKSQESKEDPQHADDERTDFENPTTQDEEEKSRDEFVHTPKDYVPTDEETNDEANDVSEEEYEMIHEELYDDVNIRLTDAGQDDKEEGDEKMADATHVATTELPHISSSRFVSSTFTNAMLNLENLQSEATTSTFVVPKTETLAAFQLKVDNLEKEVQELRKVDNSAIVISTVKSEVPNAVKDYLGTTLDDTLYKQSKEKTAEEIRKIKLEQAGKQQEPKFTITSSDSIALNEFDQKMMMIKMKALPLDQAKGLRDKRPTKDPSPLRIHYEDDEHVDDEYQDAEHNDVEFEYADILTNQEEDLGNAEDQPNNEDTPKNNWFKKSKGVTSPDLEWNEGKNVDGGPHEIWLNDMTKATNLHPYLTQIRNMMPHQSISLHWQFFYVELDYTMEECNHALSKKLNWNNPEGDRCPYDLTKPLPMQMSIEGRQIVPRDFFFNNDLAYLRGGSEDKIYTASITKSKVERFEMIGIKDIVPSLWSPVKVVYYRHALLLISHWRSNHQPFYGYVTKMISKHDVYSKLRILSVICVKVDEWYGYGHLVEIVVKRADQKHYTFKEGDFSILHLNYIEDMLLLVVQNKLNNLDGNEVVHLVVALRMFVRRTVIQATVEDLQLGVESY